MQGNTLWGIINSPLMILLIVTPIVPFSKRIFTFFYKKLFRPCPDFVVDAGINLFVYHLTRKEYSLNKITQLSSKEKYVRVISSLIILTVFGFFAIWILRVVVKTPDNYTNLTFKTTGESFLLSEIDAISFPDESKWKLDPDICHEDLYQNIALKKEISYELVFMLCTTVGFDKEKPKIEVLVNNYKNERNVYILMAALLSMYAILFSISVIAPVYVSSKLLSYKFKLLGLSNLKIK